MKILRISSIILIILLIIVCIGMLINKSSKKQEIELAKNVQSIEVNSIIAQNNIDNIVATNINTKEKVEETIQNTEEKQDLIDTKDKNEITKDEIKESTKDKEQDTKEQKIENTKDKKQEITENNTTNTTVATQNNIKAEDNNIKIENNVSEDINKEATEEDSKNNADSSRPELAYTTYRVANTSIIPEIINIIKSEIAKDTELNSYGCKVSTGNKTEAYNKTSGFTYLWVKDIEKGKITNNYVSFPDRVKSYVGVYADYYIYAEDEYTYDSRGLNPKWSQTLVWIYFKF